MLIGSFTSNVATKDVAEVSMPALAIRLKRPEPPCDFDGPGLTSFTQPTFVMEMAGTAASQAASFIVHLLLVGMLKEILSIWRVLEL
jgi:hypothetical protein